MQFSSFQEAWDAGKNRPESPDAERDQVREYVEYLIVLAKLAKKYEDMGRVYRDTDNLRRILKVEKYEVLKVLLPKMLLSAPHFPEARRIFLLTGDILHSRAPGIVEASESYLERLRAESCYVKDFKRFYYLMRSCRRDLYPEMHDKLARGALRHVSTKKQALLIFRELETDSKLQLEAMRKMLMFVGTCDGFRRLLKYTKYGSRGEALLLGRYVTVSRRGDPLAESAENEGQ